MKIKDHLKENLQEWHILVDSESSEMISRLKKPIFSSNTILGSLFCCRVQTKKSECPLPLITELQFNYGEIQRTLLALDK